MGRTNEETKKVSWSGRIVAVQPRIRLTRSFDQRYHTYQGYILRIEGTCGDVAGEFTIAVGKAAHEKHRFHTGMELSGFSFPVDDPRLETAGFYKTSGLRIVNEKREDLSPMPPFHGVPPDLDTYRGRGHRRLSTSTFDRKCSTCVWGCRMPVEMIVDQWNQSNKRYRFETFCYGPKNCPLYQPGPTRKVPGRGGMSWEEADWVDEESTAHRGPND